MSEHIGEFLRSKRLYNLKLSLREFCKKYDLDIYYISKLENDLTRPPEEHIDLFKNIFDFSEEDVLILKELIKKPFTVKNVEESFPFPPHKSDGTSLSKEELVILRKFLEEENKPITYEEIMERRNDN